MVKITSAASSPAWQRAIARASAQYHAGIVAKATGYRTYTVPSSTGTGTYQVEIINPTTLQASCTCPCGKSERTGVHCWHSAQALSLEIERVSRPPTKLAAAFTRSFSR